MSDVVVSVVAPDGGSKEVYRRHNVVAFSSADILARMVGGQFEWAPRYVGFIYAPSDYTGFTSPDSAAVPRNHSWDVVAADVLASAGNMVVSPVSKCAEYAVSADAAGMDYYECNKVTLHAVSASSAAPVFSGGGYLMGAPYVDGASRVFFQAVLLARFPEAGASDFKYAVYARVQLGTAPAGQPMVGNGAEVSVQWPITFK
jgi:hypothetical protein